MQRAGYAEPVLSGDGGDIALIRVHHLSGGAV
ncbi:hypothetical protein SAMN04489732_103368 [Amycolatopsis saalfeldensis]|uniref:Uncharacterized protein n=1 Tax=Amycolatopsis saalfeldensis TaxID=394193 RepID=A0A1H8UNC0_9PSEU|nr:hypothetical protein SAMN04489732_103368 [Amycolatopsis saalfeldensis]